MVKDISEEANKLDNDLLYFGKRDGVMVRIRNQAWTKVPEVREQNSATFYFIFLKFHPYFKRCHSGILIIMLVNPKSTIRVLDLG